MQLKIFASVFILLLILPVSSRQYPIDGYDYTGIRRLAYLRDVINGEVKGKMPLPGAQKSINDIKLNLVDRPDFSSSLPTPDPALQKDIDALFSKYNPNYSVTVLDITPGRAPRYAKRKETNGYQPGSVGKLAVAAGFYCELENLYPNHEDRMQLLRTRMIKAGTWVLPEHHTIPFYDPETKKFFKRIPQATDVLPLYEWVDHMLSVSSNGAASVVWREAILMRVFGDRYAGLTAEEGEQWFKDTPKSEIRDITIDVVNSPLRDLGISEDEWRLGSMFTYNAKPLAPGGGGSIGTPVGLIKFLVAVESGKLVDHWSSLEVKRMIYMTDRRIRYASSPALDSAAVYFKSGSLYSCKDKSTGCGKYKGDTQNYMNSIAIVEQPDSTTYIVAMMSNVFLKNSAWDHRVLAAGIDKLMREGEILETPEKYQESKLEGDSEQTD